MIDGKDGSVLQDLSASPTRHADAPNGTIAELTAAGYFVIVDSPPVLTHASTLEMAQATDATLILCSDANTTVSSYGAAIKRLELVQATIAGAVLNISKPHHSRRRVWPRGAGRAGRLLH